MKIFLIFSTFVKDLADEGHEDFFGKEKLFRLFLELNFYILSESLNDFNLNLNLILKNFNL